MRFQPTSPRSRAVLLAGALAASGALLTGCSGMPFDLGDGWGEDLGELELPDLGSALPSASPEAQEGEDAFALPSSCAEIGADGLAGGHVPAGAALSEDAEPPAEGGSEAQQLSCVWTGAEAEGGAPTLALVFTLNADPADTVRVAESPEEQADANWEVDVDVYGDTYHSAAADELDGELEYMTTVEGSTRHVILSLPDDFHVTATALHTGVEQEELEQLAVQAAQQVRGG